MRKVLVRQADGVVTNCLEWDSVASASYTPPPGHILVDASTSGSPGDTWDGTVFITPVPVVVVDLVAQAIDIITAPTFLTLTLDQKKAAFKQLIGRS